METLAARAKRGITVIGAGILGCWQALALARAGFAVRLVEREAKPLAGTSALAGAMLAPWAEAEAAPSEIAPLGIRALALWRESGLRCQFAGTLIIAAPRDTPELARFAAAAPGGQMLLPVETQALEPALGLRPGLSYPQEGHLEPAVLAAALPDALAAAGVALHFGTDEETAIRLSAGRLVIDCTGMAAALRLPALRGVRGEMAIIETTDITFGRPVRLLHPRHPLYIVPWANGRFMIGATAVESASTAPVTVRSALDLLGLAFAVHPAFGEARIVAMHAGVRPAFADNMPRVIAHADSLAVNGAYRHGYLLAPVLAEAVVGALTGGQPDARVFAPAAAGLYQRV